MPEAYTLMTATLEIVVMLLAAFLLGWLFCWLMKKIFARKQDTSALDEPHELKEPDIGTHSEHITATSTSQREPSHEPETSIPQINTKVDDKDHLHDTLPNKGTTKDAASRPRIDIADLTTPDLNLSEINKKTDQSNTKEDLATAVTSSAILASQQADKTPTEFTDTASTTSDTDATEVQADKLNASSAQPADSDKADMKRPSTRLSTPSVALDLPEENRDNKSTSTSKPLDELVDHEGALNHPELPVQANQSSPSTDDDLTRITGMTPALVSLLNSKGIKSFKDLQSTNRSTLKSYLEHTGNPKLKEIEPASWPHQAKLCVEKNWRKLAEYQSFLSGSSIEVVEEATTDNAEKDDLKRIEGIGPLFEGLLNKAGIYTFHDLHQSNRDSLKKIIDAAGPEYKLHEPETWPYQAGLADRGEWKKLRDYIHFMTGRA